MLKPNPNDSLMIIKPKSEAMLAEYPAERRWVVKVEYPKEGGVLTYFQGERFPEKQLVYPEMFACLNPFKRSLTVVFRLFKSHLGKVLVFFGGIFWLNKKFRETVTYLYVETFWSGLSIVAMRPAYYCQAARELRRVGLQCGYSVKMVDMLCLFFEYDNAYRYRVQDFFGILDKERFLADPGGELKRVVVEYKKRELVLNEKFSWFEPFLPLIFRIPKLRRKAIEFVKELDIEQVRLDTGDRYWCYHRTDYNFDGLDLIDRMRKRSLMKLGVKR